ncbi:hypothetical protein Y88_3864 [Novosphingobium nitrogenifigens DSM 19370]|uniref:Uncharacterized protein n=2 Tax=Novosphingobium nitrogenifigens TaxID=378548 RepID=F1ZCW1_9SPHN|nr:hypothetical protein Y88_3864 [Novosphingobium nitrogenifigens DSM 19370]
MELAINALAARQGMHRNEWLRRVAQEALDADEQGRPLFQKIEGPRIDTSLNVLAADLRSVLLEWDRVQRENERREMHMIGLWTGGEEANRLAYERLSERILGANKSSYEPFVWKVRELRAEMEGVSSKCADTIDARLTPLKERLEQIHALASEPRVNKYIVFSKDWMLARWPLTVAVALVMSCGVLAGLIVPGFSDRMAVSQAGHLITSADRMCRLIERQYNAEDCNVPSTIRKLGRTDGMSGVTK